MQATAEYKHTISMQQGKDEGHHWCRAYRASLRVGTITWTTFTVVPISMRCLIADLCNLQSC
jgi:hypothetical protein